MQDFFISSANSAASSFNSLKMLAKECDQRGYVSKRAIALVEVASSKKHCTLYEHGAFGERIKLLRSTNHLQKGTGDTFLAHSFIQMYSKRLTVRKQRKSRF